MNPSFNDRMRQIILLAIVITLGLLLIFELYIFLPGLLGGITFYILGRGLFFQCVYQKKWRKGWTAILFILVLLVIISIPIYISAALISPKINDIVNNQDKIMSGFKVISEKVKEATGMQLMTAENIKNISLKISSFVPTIINSTATIASNLIMMFFLLYYLLVNGAGIEKYLSKIIPLKKHNVQSLANETKVMIRANALGIPIICVVQGLFATLGYWIFGIEDWGLWGFLTGVFAFFPLVGTMIVWVPIVVFMFATNLVLPGIGLAIYSFVVTGNVDYFTRLGLLKRLGDVHPMVTVLGVIVGLNLFGFMGLIFGPLLVSYFIILLKIYINEFSDEDAVVEPTGSLEEHRDQAI
jgi:predicted PurR-regulated permease PerM